MNNVALSRTKEEELTAFFEFQLDPEARHLAAFMAQDSTDKDAYLKKHGKFLQDPTINGQTVWVDGEIAGSIAKFVMEGDAEITYWIGRKFWNKGIATEALAKFLEMEKTRPLFGRVAFDNFGSQRVLEKCGFNKIGTDVGFSNERQTQVEECIYKLSE